MTSEDYSLIVRVERLRHTLMRSTFVFGMARAKMGPWRGTNNLELQSRLERGARTTATNAAREYDLNVRQYLAEPPDEAVKRAAFVVQKRNPGIPFDRACDIVRTVAEVLAS